MKSGNSERDSEHGYCVHGFARALPLYFYWKNLTAFPSNCFLAPIQALMNSGIFSVEKCSNLLAKGHAQLKDAKKELTSWGDGINEWLTSKEFSVLTAKYRQWSRNSKLNTLNFASKDVLSTEIHGICSRKHVWVRLVNVCSFVEAQFNTLRWNWMKYFLFIFGIAIIEECLWEFFVYQVFFRNGQFIECLSYRQNCMKRVRNTQNIVIPVQANHISLFLHYPSHPSRKDRWHFKITNFGLKTKLVWGLSPRYDQSPRLALRVAPISSDKNSAKSLQTILMKRFDTLLCLSSVRGW